VLSQPQMALLGTARADVVIANDDSAVHASIADLEVDEGDDGVKSVPVTVHFDQPVSGSGKLRITLVGAGAVADQDFRALSETYYPSAGATQMTFNIEVLSDTQAECDEGLFIEYTEVYMGDDTTKTAKMVLRNDDGPAQGCSDPFSTPALPAPPWDGGASSPPPVDADIVKANPDASTVKAIPDASRSSEAGPDTFASAGSDTQIASGAGADIQAALSGGLVDLPDSGAAVPQGQRLAKSSGCSCSMTAPSRDAGLLAFALAGFVAVRVRRSRSR